MCALARLDADASAIEVTLRIDPDALPEPRHEVSLAFRADVLGPRSEEHVTMLDGASWPSSLGAVSEPVTLRYRVRLDGAAAMPGASWRRPGGWHLTGKSFLPDVMVDGRAVDVPATLDLDVGDRPLFTAAGPDRRLFDAASLRRLADEAYEVGPLTLVRREVGSTVVWTGTSAEEAERLDGVADVLARALASLGRRLGPPPTDGVLVVYHPVDAPPWAERLGASIVVARREGLPGDALYGTGVALRELAHLWTPGTHANAEAWLSEGVTEYLAIVTAAELSGAPPSSIARVVLRRHRARAADAPPRSREVGLAAGFCLDAYLRESGSSLGAALRTTLDRDADEPLGAEALIEDLAAVSPAGASYLAALLASDAGFSIDECLERAGFRAREVSYDGLGDRAIVIDVLGIDGLRPFDGAQAFEVDAADEEAALAAGDVVLEVNGAAVGDLDDVAWVLRDARPGERVHVTSRRRGERRSTELTVPELGEDAREQRSYVELVPIE